MSPTGISRCYGRPESDAPAPPPHDALVRQTDRVRFDVEPEPITASDDEIRASLTDAQIPPLLASVAHLTGDLSIVRDDLLPDLTRMLEPDAGYSPDQIAE